MVRSNWSEIKIGDFFISSVQIDGQDYLYQKIDSEKANGYNAILLNTGELCYLYVRPDSTAFQKVTVTFEYKPITE